MLDFLEIYKDLNFLSESIRLQYSNFIFKNQINFNKFLSYDDVIQKIRMDEPIEYIFNSAEFFNNKFYVDKRCLIPRPETERIITLTLDFISKNNGTNFTIIDVGTGSGCIIVTLAKILNKKHKFLGIDISSDALEVANINKEIFKLKNIELINSNFQDFDFKNYSNLIICSNLPYIPNTDNLQKSVINFEPHQALFGGEKGDELNNNLLSILKGNSEVKLIVMEGYDGEVVAH